MAVSKVVIWNSAISGLGGDATGIIQDVNDEGDVAKWLRLFEEEASDYCISLFDWEEAEDFSELAPTAETLVVKFKDYTYNKPPDFLRMGSFVDSVGEDIDIFFKL